RGSGSPAGALRTRWRGRRSRRHCAAPPGRDAGCAGSALRGACERSVVAQLAQERARLALDVVDLLGRQIAAPAADRAAVDLAERLGEGRRIRLEPTCDPL